jgi:hypothetical protein
MYFLTQTTAWAVTTEKKFLQPWVPKPGPSLRQLFLETSLGYLVFEGFENPKLSLISVTNHICIFAPCRRRFHYQVLVHCLLIQPDLITSHKFIWSPHLGRNTRPKPVCQTNLQPKLSHPPRLPRMTVSCPSAPVSLAPGGVKQEEAPKGSTRDASRSSAPSGPSAAAMPSASAQETSAIVIPLKGEQSSIEEMEGIHAEGDRGAHCDREQGKKVRTSMPSLTDDQKRKLMQQISQPLTHALQQATSSYNPVAGSATPLIGTSSDKFPWVPSRQVQPQPKASHWQDLLVRARQGQSTQICGQWRCRRCPTTRRKR